MSTHLDPVGYQFYRDALALLQDSQVPFLVGGAYAFQSYTGIHRNTRDFDVFVRPKDADHVLERFAAAGYRTQRTFRHWLGKVFHRDYYVDIIYSSGNGLCRVDDAWFEHANDGEVLDVTVKLCPIEEMIWSKGFIMERERFDGADINHLIHAGADRMDWERLIARFGNHGRVLLVHLLMFGFVYPGERERVPGHVIDALVARIGDVPVRGDLSRMCAGTLLSRSQYLQDLAQGYRDARLEPLGNMTREQIDVWTAAADEEPAPPPAPIERMPARTPGTATHAREIAPIDDAKAGSDRRRRAGR